MNPAAPAAPFGSDEPDPGDEGASSSAHEAPTWVPLDGPDVLFDPLADPGAAALGASGSEASSDLSWPLLLRQRVTARAERSPRYKWVVLGSLLAGLLALNITFTVFVVALLKVSSDLHTPTSVLTWTSTAPLLAFGLAAPIFGKVGDLFGHRRLYLLGLTGAMVSAILTATAPTVGVLIFARALDGVQGAATGTASMAIILELFAPAERVKALGWWALVGAGGPVLGVSVGAPIIGAYGWRALFWGQLCLLIVAAVVVAILLPARGRHSLPALQAEEVKEEKAEVVPVTVGAAADQSEVEEAPTGPGWRGMDWVGSWSLSGAVTGFMLAVSIGPIVGWATAPVFLSALGAVICTAIFMHRELTYEAPLIPTKYMRRRNFVFPMGTRAFTNFAYFGGFFLFPLMMEEVFGYHVTQVGLISIVRPLLFAVSAPIAGYLAVRIGERTSAMVGAISVTLSMIVFGLLRADSPLIMIVAALALAGLGMGVALPSTSSTMSNEVSSSEYGVMSAAQLLATQVGEVAGIQILLTIQESFARNHATSGVHHDAALLASFRVAFFIGAAVALVGFVCATFIRPLARKTEPATNSGG
jgi:MFS family permease